MATETFGRALALVLDHEGGYVDHPADPGGATNLGITIGTLSDWIGRPATKAEVRALKPSTVAPIYRANYWKKIRGDELPVGVDYCVFDAAVNSGPSRAARWLQRAVGATADGVVGSETLAAVEKVPPTVIINRMCDDRLNFLQGLPTWGTFGKGWKKRVEGIRKEALAMAQGAEEPVVIARPEPDPPPRPEPQPVAMAPEPPTQPATPGGFFAVLKAFLEALFGRKA